MPKITLQRHLNRFCTFYADGDPLIPNELYHITMQPANTSQVKLPMPSKRSGYTCQAATRDGIVWFGAKTGLTRYDPNAHVEADVLMYFGARRDIPHNEVLALLPVQPMDETIHESLWVLTKGGAARIDMKWMDAEQKANHLLQETLDVVDRRGMVTQRWLAKPRDMSSALPYNESDNDGCFGCSFAIGELMHYAVLKRELGAEHPETQRIKKVATRASEAMLLLTYIPARGDGFVARTYLAPHEPVPNFNYFFRKMPDGTAQIVPTPTVHDRGLAGKSAPHDVSLIPDRLRKLYLDEGIGDLGIAYKGDTSSDELTLHFAHFYYLNKILGEDDLELAALSRQACINVMEHLMRNNREMSEPWGPTTWGKWSLRYFQSDIGWIDSCLNSAQYLMYLRVTMDVAGEQGKWKEEYDLCISQGYAERPQHHAERFEIMAQDEGVDLPESIMYGDHMLAVTAFWLLLLLEPDEELRAKFTAGFKSWRGSIGREHNPGYDLPFHLACPDEPIDWAKLEHWFYRSPQSRLASNVSLSVRHDIPVRLWRGSNRDSNYSLDQSAYLETGFLLPDDERFISKYDRNPHQFRDWDDGEGQDCLVESCYVYTFPYWFGRYYDMIGA
ncbi:MAG: hypothetical protein FWD06_00465 [Oscillospiraceae bacterium]|nr:hypothetical protein [Oscillospiraceae bacterium]